MKTNPFKFGTVVDGPYFTDREEEQARISSHLKSTNHLTLISPRRFGKTSLIRKVVNESGRKTIFIDMQLILSPEDFAAQLLRRIYRLYPIEKLKNYLKSFRLIPIVSINPVTGETDISFNPGSRDFIPLEDVLNLIEKLGNEKQKIIVVLDEFQEIFRIDGNLDRFLRSVMQNHRHISYLFMGSSESMIREIFEKKNSPFYRFGTLMNLSKIPYDNFFNFLNDKFAPVTDNSKELSGSVLDFTGCHPFYTQQLAFTVWELLVRTGWTSDIVSVSADEIVQSHDNDYERLWNTLNRTDMAVLTGICASSLSPLSADFAVLYGAGAPSTVFSTLKRLARKGMLLKEGTGYLIDDPFFRKWILLRRNG